MFERRIKQADPMGDSSSTAYVAGVHDDEWIATGPHEFVDCWCGHVEPLNPGGRTLDRQLDRVHRWVNVGCDVTCPHQTRIHGHVHVHCPECARRSKEGTCCDPV
jgi:hypothetical protein